MKRYTIFIDGEQNVVKMSILFPFFFFQIKCLTCSCQHGSELQAAVFCFQNQTWKTREGK